MVNASDVAAMGGRPIAVVDAVWANGADGAGAILDGLAAGAQAYGIPIVGGHTNTRSDRGQLSVAILGRAARLISSFAARPGETLLAAIDLRGRLRAPAPWWDASSHVTDPGALRARLEILPGLAEDGLTSAGKDISMGGLIGTALMLAEASRIGVTIDVHAVPRPDGIEAEFWLTCFPSFGFLLTASATNVEAIIARFEAHGITCAAIGACDASGLVRVVDDGAVETVWDVGHAPLIGCHARPGD
jgi:AIR synthase-related protein